MRCARLTRLSSERFSLIVTLTLAFMPAAALGQDIGFENARIVDPAKREVIGGAILVRNGTIVAVRPALPADFQGTRVDLEGRWVIPGLVDMHTHSFGNGSPAGAPQVMGPDGVARVDLYAGVVAFLDLFSQEDSIFGFRDLQRSDGRVGAAVFAAGPCLTATKGHCSEYALADCASRGAEEEQTFAEATIRENVGEYLRMLVAADPPTLAAFNRFHGHHDEDEVAYELRECRKKWNQGLISINGQLDLEPDCKEFVRSRAANPSDAPSLYLGALRSALSSPGAMYRIRRVQRMNGTDPNRAFLVHATIGSQAVEIMHASNPTYSVLGLLSFFRIDGEPVALVLAGAKQ